MGRGHFHPKRCRVCGDGEHNGVHVSQTGLCPDHSVAVMADNIRQLAAHDGPNFTHWRYRLAASVGAIPVDLLPDE